MAKKSKSALIETEPSEILNENAASTLTVENEDVGEGIIENDAIAVDEVAVAEEVTQVKKKSTPRKRTVASAETKAKKSTVKRSSRTKIDGAESTPPAPVMKAFWGVFNPMMVQVAQYNYADEAEAKKVAADMTEKKKAPHFVQLIKKVI